MQDCFRQHPDVYGAELEDDEPEGDAPAPAAADVNAELAESNQLVPKTHHDVAEKTQDAN